MEERFAHLEEQVERGFERMGIAIEGLVRFMHQNESIRSDLRDLESRVRSNERWVAIGLGLVIAVGSFLAVLQLILN